MRGPLMVSMRSRWPNQPESRAAQEDADGHQHDPVVQRVLVAAGIGDQVGDPVHMQRRGQIDEPDDHAVESA